MKKEDLPQEEKNFQKAYIKAPSFLSIHLGVKADVLPPDTDCHHFILEVRCLLTLKHLNVLILFFFYLPHLFNSACLGVCRIVGKILKTLMEVYS